MSNGRSGRVMIDEVCRGSIDASMSEDVEKGQ